MRDTATKRALFVLFYSLVTITDAGRWKSLRIVRQTPEAQGKSMAVAYRDDLSSPLSTSVSPTAATAITEPTPTNEEHINLAADHLRDSISHMTEDGSRIAVKAEHRHRDFLRRSMQKSEAACQRKIPVKGSLEYAFRVGLAGGLAGAAGTATLYPMDTAKTLRQAEPSKYKNVYEALGGAMYDRIQGWHIARVYRGVVPSTLGAIPSSALYFGAYEGMKSVIQCITNTDPNNGKVKDRLIVHSLSAASGNFLSSAIFVPKEAIKSQMQYMGNANLAQAATNLCRTQGIRGLYSGYKATLLRNVPTAALRFTLYEELKYQYLKRSNTQPGQQGTFRPGLFVAGAVSGTMASALMTPIDVLKTRIATGTCPADMPNCARCVIQEAGIGGLYAGAGSRMLASALFSAIGFGVFEAAKTWMGVGIETLPGKTAAVASKSGSCIMYTRRQRRLDHAVSDAPLEHKQ